MLLVWNRDLVAWIVMSLPIVHSFSDEDSERSDVDRGIRSFSRSMSRSASPRRARTNLSDSFTLSRSPVSPPPSPTFSRSPSFEVDRTDQSYRSGR